jgi:DNA-binding winged helix-turn-helix (wHTH) protein
MLHSLALEKSLSSVDSAESVPRGPQRIEEDEFVYMLLPDSNGYRVLRAPLERFLSIAEPVSELPRNAPTANFAIIPDVGPTAPDGGANGAGTPVGTLSELPRLHSEATKIRFGNVEIDAPARVVTRAGAPVPLAPLEFELLLTLYRRAGAAVSRKDLMRELWSQKKGVTSRTVDTHIFNLRRKLEKDPRHPEHLLTVSKVGYRLQAHLTPPAGVTPATPRRA